MNNIFDTYIPKFLVNLTRDNEDIKYVSSSAFSVEGDVYELDVRVVQPNVLQTEKSIKELRPNVSDTYPFKIVLPLEKDSSNVLQISSTNTFPTASQYYYVPMYFERFTVSTHRTIDKEFKELGT
jgi:hypothetical protein